MNRIRHHAAPADPDSDQALGWEGHVNIPNAPTLTNLLNNWPELRTGLAFSMVFVTGAFVGWAVCAALSGHKRTGRE